MTRTSLIEADLSNIVYGIGEQIRKRRCKASFSYAPQHEDELELKVGDVIEIIAEVRLFFYISFKIHKTTLDSTFHTYKMYI